MTQLTHGDRIPREVIWAWLAVLATAVAIAITYARLPVTEFYNVSESGLSGGLGRALVYSNFSTAFVAIALLGFAVSALLAGARPGVRGLVICAGLLSLLLCLLTAGPGVVMQSDLDGRPINLLPFAGVIIAAALTWLAVRRGGIASPTPHDRGDRLRCAIAVILIVAGLPWVLADLGVYVSDLPLLDNLFMSKEIPARETLRAVHLGHHHGMDGLVLALMGLLLGPRLVTVSHDQIRQSLSWYLPLMVTYGVANMLNDLWLEQLVKRGTVSVEVPDMLRPALAPEWAVLIAATVVVRWLMYSLATTTPIAGAPQSQIQTA